MSISLRRGPFRTKGILETGGGGAHILWSLKDERRRALGMGHLSARDSMKGTLREGSFTGDPERYVKQGSEMGVCFHRGPATREHKGVLLS